MPFLIRSVTFFEQAAEVAPAGSVIVPFIVTRMKRPLILAVSLSPGPVKETGRALDALSMVTLAEASALFPARSAKDTLTVAKPCSGNVKVAGLPVRSGRPALVQRIDAGSMPEPPVSGAFRVNGAGAPARAVVGPRVVSYWAARLG